MSNEPTVPGQLDAINERLDEGDRRMARIEAQVAENTSITRGIESNTRALVDFFDSMQGAFRVLELLGRIAKPMAWIATLGAAVYGLWSQIKAALFIVK